MREQRIEKPSISSGASTTAVCVALVLLLLWPDLHATSASYTRAGYILPPDLKQNAFTFAGEAIPLERRDVAARVIDQVNFLLMDRRAVMMEWFDRMAVYGPLIRTVLRREQTPSDMLYLAALLSDLLPNATTRSGGVGWWALGSASLRRHASPGWLSTDEWDDRRDPVASTQLAAKMLKGLVHRGTSDDWLLAIAAFLDGPEAVDALVKRSPGFSYWGIAMPPYSDVAIPRLVALKLIDSHRMFYSVDVPRLRALAFDNLIQLKLSRDLPLHLVAKWCGTNPRAIWELNPGVDPSAGVLPKADKRNPSGYPLRVPKGMGGKVRAMLAREGYLAR
jgi:membrane-bound lytic murein transglycosylase D